MVFGVNGLSLSRAGLRKQQLKPAKTNNASVKNSHSLPQAYAPSFGHRLPLHMAYGVNFSYKDGALKKARARLFTFKDVEKVELQVARAIDNVADTFLTSYKSDVPTDKLKIIPMKKLKPGHFDNNNIPLEQLSPGDRYRFKITKSDGKESFISDLYAKEMPNPFLETTKLSDEARAQMQKNSLESWPVAYDDNAYKFSQEHLDWVAGKNHKKISPTNPNLTHHTAMRIMQVHVGTLPAKSKNAQGVHFNTFDDAIEHLDKVKELGLNTVELLPHGYFHKTNWGYDPAFPFASQYGGNDAFKKFCDEAHKKEINVVVDLVTNHHSMDGEHILAEAGPYARTDSKHGFGYKYNFDGEGKEDVRDWRVNESLYWLKNGADGIRYDLTEFTESKGFLTQLSVEVKHHFPDAVMIAEHDTNEIVQPLRGALASRVDDSSHTKIIQELLDGGKHDTSTQGFDARWHFGASHAIENAALRPFSRNLTNADDSGLDKKIWDAQHQVKTFLSHDEIAKQEADGNDFVVKKLVSTLFDQDLYTPNGGNAKMHDNWKVSRAVRKLTNIFETGKQWPSPEKQTAQAISKAGGNPDDVYDEMYGVLDFEKGGFGLNRAISKEEFANALDVAKTTTKNAMAFTFSKPGPKQIFQLFERPDKRFPFFRETTDSFRVKDYHEGKPRRVNGDWEDIDKGHRVDAKEIIDEARMDVQDGEYTEQAKKYQDGMTNLIKALSKINDENPALQSGFISKPLVHEGSSVTAFHSKKGDNEIFAITSFDEINDFKGNYGIDFPKGKWVEILNTDAKEFDGRGEFLNSGVIDAADSSHQKISIPRSSTMVFKKVDDSAPIEPKVVKVEDATEVTEVPIATDNGTKINIHNPNKNDADDAANLPDASDFDEPKPDTDNSKKKSKLPWAIGLGVGAGLGAIVAYYKNKKDSSNKKPLNKMA